MKGAQGIAASALSGIRWAYLGGTCSMLCSLITGIVLARILGPKPYGQVVLASTIYGVIGLFADGGFGQALIQRRSLDDKEIRKAFSWQVALALNATVALSLLAPWIAGWFRDLSAIRVIQVMSWAIVFQAGGLVSAALLRRRLQFRIIQCAGLASYAIAYFGVGIPLAFLGAGVWSLVAAALCQCLLNSGLLYSAARHSLAPNFGLPDRSMAMFGGTVVATNLVNWGHLNLDNLAAAQLGPMALGLYGRACNVAYQPVNAVVSGVQSVLMASTSRVHESKRYLGPMTVALMAIIFAVLGCAYAICAFIPETIIVGAFGEKWRGLVPLMLPLAIAMPLYGVHCLFGPILCGLGKPHFELWPQVISCAAGAIALFAAARISAAAIAWTLLGVTIFRLALVASCAFRTLGIGWGIALRMFVNRGAVAVIFGGLTWSADQILRAPFHFSAISRLLIVAPFCAIGFGWMVWSEGEILFGRSAIEFLLEYTELLPQPYVKQLRSQAYWLPSTDFSISHRYGGTRIATAKLEF
jgi:lipopolysaccharide exporter